jgi:hypothetical protein
LKTMDGALAVADELVDQTRRVCRHPALRANGFPADVAEGRLALYWEALVRRELRGMRF